MLRRKTVLTALALFALIATSCQVGVTMFAACTPAADGNPTGTDGKYVLICQDGEWEPVMTVDEFLRIRQGQAVTIAPLPQRPKPPAPTPVRKFARAYTNVNGIPGYQPGDGDVMIAELQDTNGDDVVSVGDTVVTNKHPLSVASPHSFGSFGKKSHKVVSVAGANSVAIGVSDSIGNDFVWGRDATGEGYFEDSPAILLPIAIYDTFERGETDIVSALSSAPSMSLSPVDSFVADSSGGNGAFVEVQVNP